MLQSGGNLAMKKENDGKTEISLKYGKCYKDGSVAKRLKILEIDGNLAKIRKGLKRRKSC